MLWVTGTFCGTKAMNMTMLCTTIALGSSISTSIPTRAVAWWLSCPERRLIGTTTDPHRVLRFMRQQGFSQFRHTHFAFGHVGDHQCLKLVRQTLQQNHNLILFLNIQPDPSTTSGAPPANVWGASAVQRADSSETFCSTATDARTDQPEHPKLPSELQQFVMWSNTNTAWTWSDTRSTSHELPSPHDLLLVEPWLIGEVFPFPNTTSTTSEPSKNSSAVPSSLNNWSHSVCQCWASNPLSFPALRRTGNMQSAFLFLLRKLHRQ